MMNPNCIVIAGGAGFIGANFVRCVLANTAARVVVFDKLTYAGNRESLEDVAQDTRFEFVQGDITDSGAVRALFARLNPDWFVNFAAESHVDRSIDGPRAFLDTNVVGTFELLEAARAYVAQGGDDLRERFRYLHVSTDEVYGSLGSTGAFVETTPYAPNSPYAATKAAADHLVRSYAHTFGLPVMTTNCSNNYGPYQYPEKLIPLTVLNAARGENLPIYGTGENVRDWLHVEDHCRAILMVLERGRVGQQYNIGGFGERSNIAVVDAICAALEALLPARSNEHLTKRGLTSYGELKTFVADRPGHDLRYAIDSAKITSELGWRALRSFDEGLKSTVAWYLDNARWCETVQKNKYRRQRLGLGGST